MKHIASCEIIKDLLPNYIENVLSKEGKELVKEHIDGCSKCREEYEVISSNLSINNVDKVKINYLKKVNKRFLIILILLSIVTAISSVSLILNTDKNIEEGILTLIFFAFIIIAIIIKFIAPLFGLIFSIVYIKKTHKKILVVPIIICSMWLLNSIYIYIKNLIYY